MIQNRLCVFFSCFILNQSGLLLQKISLRKKRNKHELVIFCQNLSSTIIYINIIQRILCFMCTITCRKFVMILNFTIKTNYVCICTGHNVTPQTYTRIHGLWLKCCAAHTFNVSHLKPYD